MAKKFDGVIEAVRYKNGQILLARAYERRGPTFSDHVLLDRKTLLDRIQKGKVFVTGKREELKASTFKVGKPLVIVKQNGKEWISTRHDASHDEIEEVPVF